MEETLKLLGADSEDLYFWSLHQDGELDLFWKNGQKRIGFEFKYSDQPKITSSMRKAIDLLNLGHLYIIYPGTKKAVLSETVTLIPFGQQIKNDK